MEKNYGYGMFFPLTDAAGSVTDIVYSTGAVHERYIYNTDRMVQAYSGTWSSFTASNSSGSTMSQIGWNVLWHGMRYDSLFFGGEAIPYTTTTVQGYNGHPGSGSTVASTSTQTLSTGGGF